MKVTVTQQPTIHAANVNLSGRKEVVAVGIQGPAGPNVLSEAEDVDVDVTTIKDGSVLVFKAITGKWTSTTILDSQNMEGGEY